MHGPSHLIISWIGAEVSGLKEPRERRIIALSGLAPDIDVLAYIAAIIYFGFDQNLAFTKVWQVVHHHYTHGLGFVLFTGLVTFLLAYRKVHKTSLRQALKISILSMLASIIHVLADLVASGSSWPVYPFWPLSDFAWSVSWSYSLADWRNNLILFLSLVAMMLYAKFKSYSPLESINYNLDKAFVNIIQKGRTRESKNANKHRIIIYSFLILLILAILTPLGFQLESFNLPKF